MTIPPILATAAALAVAAAPLAGAATTASAGPAGVHAAARVAVTIQADGTDLSGVVRGKPACRSGVNVVVYKQKGARGGGDDTRFAMDTSDADGSWDTGNTGTEGRFYAKVRVCGGASSATVKATRNP